MNSLHGKTSQRSGGFKPESIIWILHELDAFICKALKGEAIVCYCESLITQQMKASDSCKIQGLITDVQYLYQFLIFKCHVVF